MRMDNKLEHPKTPSQIEIYQGFLDIARRFNISEETIAKIKEDLHFEETPTYPDGTWFPIRDMQNLGKITPNTNIK